MSLYRIMLVDDEEEVRKAMIRKMDWEQLGFTVAGDAENGEDALEKLEMLEPDVVMTDIRMPYMDGLTLVAKIREKYPFIKILIFSGYDDFEYAKQAIKYRVTEYILKPVNGEELSEILTRVRISLDEEIEQRRNISALQESYENSLPMLRELFLNDLVGRGADVSGMVPKLREYGIDILDARRWLAAVIYVEHIEQSEEQEFFRHQELIPISVRQLAEDHLKTYGRFAAFNSAEGITLIAAVDENNVIVVKDLSEDDSPQEIERCAAAVAAYLRKESFKNVRIAYGTVVNEIKGVSSSYKEAKMALDVGKIFFGERDVIAYSELGIGRLIYQLPIPLCKMFIKEIFDGKSPDEFDEETLVTINKFFENSLNVSETSRQLFIHRNTLVYRLDKLQKSTGLDLRVFEDAITFKIALMVVKYMKYMESFEF